MRRENTGKGRPTRNMRVLWEQAPDPDPEALTKAFAMLFRGQPEVPEESGAVPRDED